jgi:hypothetical protein
VLQKLSLKDMPTFQHLKNACITLNITGLIDMDGLYANSEPINPNLSQLASFVVSLPASSAFPGRIFSLMASKWRTDRNRMSVSLVSAELQVFTNYGLDCRDFYSFVINDRKVLDAAAGNAKYVWKKKRVAAVTAAVTAGTSGTNIANAKS